MTPKKASVVLRESQQTRKQTFGSFIKMNYSKQIESYCSLGALLCEAKLFTPEGSIKSEYPEVLAKLYNIGRKGFEIDKSIHSYSTIPCLYKDEFGQCNGRHDNNVFDLIIHLNDSHHYSFERMAEVLEKLNL